MQRPRRCHSLTLAGKDAPRGLKKLRFLAFLTFPKKRTKTRVFELNFLCRTIPVPLYYIANTLNKHFEYTSCVGVPSTKLVYLPGRTIEAVSPVNLALVPVPLYPI